MKPQATVDDVAKQLGDLQIDSKHETEKVAPEVDDGGPGPIMGFFAVTPISECPHCVPGVHITPVEAFKEVTVKTPCHCCDHTKENWVCLCCKVVGCSRYVKSHMVSHNEETKHPIALSFADFSYWCYDCDSYVQSKHLDHVKKHFYAQKFGAENVSHAKEYQEIMNLSLIHI